MLSHDTIQITNHNKLTKCYGKKNIRFILYISNNYKGANLQKISYHISSQMGAQKFWQKAKLAERQVSSHSEEERKE